MRPEFHWSAELFPNVLYTQHFKLDWGCLSQEKIFVSHFLTGEKQRFTKVYSMITIGEQREETKNKNQHVTFTFFLGPFEEPRFILYKPIKIKSFLKTLSHNVATEFQNKRTYMDSSNFSRCK